MDKKDLNTNNKKKAALLQKIEDLQHQYEILDQNQS